MGKKADVIESLFLVSIGVAFLWISSSMFIDKWYGPSIGIGLIGLILILIVGYYWGLGNPREKMPPENKYLGVWYFREFKNVIVILLSVEDSETSFNFKQKPKYYEIKTERFKNFSDIKPGDLVKNLYGTIEIVSTPS